MHSDNTASHINLVIMAGGIGSRFWPMSTPKCPKQFIDILGTGKSLFQETINRFKEIVPDENVYVVTSKEYTDLVAEQAPKIPTENILAEPFRRNTAPCIAYASYVIQKKDPDALMVVTPADHFVSQTNKFQIIVQSALDWLHVNDDKMVTMGITPNRPETGYGYIQTNGIDEESIVPVIKFKEKPDEETALKYLSSGDYLWNSGIFIWHVNAITQAFKSYLPKIDELFSKNIASSDSLEITYELSPNISIDYGILEQADNIYVIKADCGWSDLGTWGSLWVQEDHDEFGNSITSEDAHLYETKNCIIRVPENKRVIIEGLEDFIVVDDTTHLLIFRKENEQLIGTYSKTLQKNK